MNLAVFDIDGTLTRTKALDEECFALALETVLGFTGMERESAAFANPTDSGICREVFVERLGRPPEPRELDRVKALFVDLFSEAARGRPADVAPVPGADAALRLLRQKGWAVAFATGCFEPSARLKLGLAGIGHDGLPLSTSDLREKREDIIAEAHRMSLDGHRQTGFERKVYIGDGPWDLRAARELGWGFVGVRDGRNPAILLDAGASTVIDDYADFGVLMDALERT